ncbi:methyltransferase, FkbM family [Ralstonia pickettii]|jgi:FkbM family methyltransferase|uniref:FkbM family methyltransferase n=5 Tax=Pseudomonadota TaxID=1224 RepID=UPI0001E6AC02|nr:MULTISPECIES: FkbM family methyltransferase [Ralstonia]EFP64317.1 methyltransferase, FkbM family [Ralstonia pickettii]EGY64239.1 FkbM family methyltransferase [Ralstonia sp. 5_2_56FAA]MBU6523683.1 FkbM family methyltransferase [Ralstonia sp. B265]NPT49369.1 FkbM family methyltransferase [Ralstonia sp. 3N]QQK35394.1 hypothetical protein RP6297_01599 [Ralstonia pickettii]
MSIISYAQNFEDVMLWRALGHVAEGFYIDVGAQHPTIDSVSKAFYEHGWRGIHVEPTSTYATLLRQDRPDETVLQAALTHTHGTLTFYEIPETGLSTADATIAERHKQQGFQTRETTVPCLTLADVFEHAGSRDIHWLKIDVEGFERQVLEGWGQSLARPWIVIVESTLPLTTIESHSHWEPLLLGRDYEHAYFDGLNRYYVSTGHPELREAFRAGPNVFDGFALNGTASAPFCHLVQAHHKTQVDCAQAELAQAKHTAQQEITRLTDALATQRELHTKQEQALGEQLRASNDAVHQLESTLVDQGRANVEKEQSLMRDHANRVESLLQQLQASETELRQLMQEGAARERELTRQAAQIREEVDELLRTLVQREKEFSQELMQTRQHGEQALADQFYASQAELRRLAQEGIEREQVLTQHNLQVRQQMEALLRSVAQRESDFARELLQTRREAEQITAEQARVHAELERTLRHEGAEREHALTEQIGQLRLEVKELLHSLAQRESEFSRELQQVHRDAQQAVGEQARVHAERDQALVQQLLTAHAELRSAEARGRDRERQLDQEISSTQAKLIQLTQAHATLEAQLREQMAAAQHTTLALKASLDAIHTSFAWRLTAPVRWIGSLLFTPLPLPRTQAAPIFSSAAAQPPAPACAAPAPTSTLTQQRPSETGISALAINTPMNCPSIAHTLDELLSYHDQQFVHSAYLTVLGRNPDPDGFRYYLARVRQGVSKIQILSQLRFSQEGKARGSSLSGLDAAVASYRYLKLPLIGWLLGLMVRVQHAGATHQKLNAIENQIYVLGDENQRRFARLENAVTDLHHAVMQQAQTTVTAQGGAPNHSRVALASTSFRPPEPEGLKQLSPRARDIYSQLKQAAATHVEGVA